MRGLDKFREKFRAHADQYILIGGTACDLLMDEAGLEFRATKDLDIVLCVEALDTSFVRAFWEFIQSGKYQIHQNAAGEKRYYRFLKPENDEYPFMLELFARKPGMLELVEGAHLTPIPVDEEISSLSAILLNDVYYAFLHSGKRTIEDIPLVGPEHLIPFKARAWLDLTKRKELGEAIDARTIVKHKKDVFRLYRILDPVFKTDIPKEIRDDMGVFLDAMVSDPVDLKALEINDRNQESILGELRRLYVYG